MFCGRMCLSLLIQRWHSRNRGGFADIGVTFQDADTTFQDAEVTW